MLRFVTIKGRPWGYSPWRRSVWLPAWARAGLAGLRFHDLRRWLPLIWWRLASTRRRRRPHPGVRVRSHARVTPEATGLQLKESGS